VTSIGLNPKGREVDDETVMQSLVCVESRSAALAAYPAGSSDLTDPIRRGLIEADHVHTELGELVLGTRPGRSTAEQITLYKSVGLAIQDATATALVLAGARERGIGGQITI
jgi:ornithine cyclodeaminase